VGYGKNIMEAETFRNFRENGSEGNGSSQFNEMFLQAQYGMNGMNGRIGGFQ